MRSAAFFIDGPMCAGLTGLVQGFPNLSGACCGVRKAVRWHRERQEKGCMTPDATCSGWFTEDEDHGLGRPSRRLALDIAWFTRQYSAATTRYTGTSEW